MRRDLGLVGLIWAGLTIVGVIVAQTDIYPPARSDKGAEIEAAFRTLLTLAVPVLAFVVAVLSYSVLRFRSLGKPAADGPALHGRGAVPVAWLVITSGLALLVMVYPGLTSLSQVLRDEPPDLVVKVDAFQWAWRATYPDAGVTTSQELVLPVDRTVRFEVTSLDVLHSFYVPAFLMKVDAVPGMTTTLSLRPTELGTYEEDPGLRIQCAELCGIAHSTMVMPVRIVPQEEFQAWLSSEPTPAPPAASPSPATGATELRVSARNSRFSTERLDAAPGKPIAITFQNDDVGIIHNIALYEPGPGGALVDDARTALDAGPVTQVLTIPALAAGTYVFRCDAHPVEMAGQLIVK